MRAARIQIGNVGAVGDHVVEAEGKQYVLRLVGITAGHTRTLAEADRSIRVAILQQKMQEKEQALEAELRQKFPVVVDDRALAAVKLPAVLEQADAWSGASPWAKSGDWADAGAKSAADAGK